MGEIDQILKIGLK